MSWLLPADVARNDIHSALMKAFQNPTKLSIILLLSGGRRLTVTQMSKSVKVTRANLYHFVGELVREGILSKPEAQVKRNYVEKYYTLNEGAFKSADPQEVERRLREGKPEDQLAVIRSFLVSLSLQFHLLSEEFSRVDDGRAREVAKALKERRIFLHYSVLADEAYLHELGEYGRIVDRSTRRWGSKSGLPSGNRLIIVGVPRLGGNDGSGTRD